MPRFLTVLTIVLVVMGTAIAGPWKRRLMEQALERRAQERAAAVQQSYGGALERAETQRAVQQSYEDVLERAVQQASRRAAQQNTQNRQEAAKEEQYSALSMAPAIADTLGGLITSIISAAKG